MEVNQKNYQFSPLQHPCAQPQEFVLEQVCDCLKLLGWLVLAQVLPLTLRVPPLPAFK